MATTPYDIEVTFRTARGLTQDDARVFWEQGNDFKASNLGPRIYEYGTTQQAKGLPDATAGAFQATIRVLDKLGYPRAEEVEFLQVKGKARE